MYILESGITNAAQLRAPMVYVKFDGADYVNSQQALVYGSVGVVKISNDAFYVLPDKYDSDIRFQSNSFLRDIATHLGGLYVGSGPAPARIFRVGREYRW